ncbi:hypothetical protein CMI37_23900 [Candidatus Pacearchaeota archaeon]|nr:hypothetical protein [Candidatus Pacearchaeota archaeon]
MADEILGRIEKQMEGSNLALAAVADVLRKMDERLSKAEEDEYQAEERSAADIEKAELVKSIATEVFDMLKSDNGLDVDGTKVRSGAKIAAGTAADDSAKQVDPTRKIEDVQATIQAMQIAKEGDEDDEDEKEHPAEEDEEVEQGHGYKSVEELTKQLNDLQLQLQNVEGNIQKQVQTESEERLRKMGFREETGLQAPKQIQYDLGTDGTTPIVKQQTEGDTVDQLVNLSYKELRELSARIQAGETEGIPRELLG